MNEINALIAKSRRYLRSAKLLLDDGDSESCVSRSYCAMFCCAQATLLTKGLTFSSHKGVISGFGEQFVKAQVFSREMGRALNKAFEKRQLGDYDTASIVSDEDAQETLKEAMDFCDTIARWIGTQRS